MNVEELTVIVCAPRGRDALLAADVLRRTGVDATVCSSVSELALHVSNAGCAVVTEEALREESRDLLSAALAAQPPWSDFPFILFAPKRGGVEVLRLAEQLGNVTLLERPVHMRTLVSAVTAALRGRRRQYEARAAIQKRDEFLAMLGHELRNPLAAITLAGTDLRRHCSPQGMRALDILERQSKHLARLVDDLLDVARVTTGKVRLQETLVDLDELVARTVQSAHSGRIDYRGTHVYVEGDPIRLEEIFSNLISNALKYSPASERVTVEVGANDDTCIVEVTDRGVGIAPEMLPRVFELFTQAAPTLDRSQGGLGIGLTIVKALVELHDGKVTATSPGLGGGSTFRIELPRAHAQETDRKSSKELPSLAGARVLVVDDNPDVVELTSLALAHVGCEVMSATTGPAGLDLLKQHPFDAAFVDIGLPGMNGYEVVRSAREDGIRTRIIAVSGYGQAGDRQRALDAGFDLHLTKPVSLDQMLRALSTGDRDL